jgi:hypothetical protein
MLSTGQGEGRPRGRGEEGHQYLISPEGRPESRRFGSGEPIFHPARRRSSATDFLWDVNKRPPASST